MNKEIEIITLGDIFKNIETEEKAFRFKDYIKDLQEENQRLNNVINETRRILGEYKHYSTPDEIQNMFNEEIVDKAYIKLHSNLNELKESDK